MTELCLFVEDVAAYLVATKEGVKTLIAEKNMPAHKAGRLRILRPSEVHAWVRVHGAIVDVPNTAEG